jgi:hypothetical protein
LGPGVLAAGAVALLILAGVFALVRVTGREILQGDFTAVEWAMSDFKSVLYYPAKAFAAGDNPYDTEEYLARHSTPFGFYLYPPIVLLLARPFAALPLGWAIAFQAALTVGLAGLLAFVSLRLSGARGRLPAVVFVTAVMLLSRPGQWNLLLGQVTLPVVLASYAALVLAPRRPLLSACALALAMIKPNFGGPLALIMLALGYGRTVLTGAGVLVLVNLPLVAVLADRAGGLLPLIEHAGGGGEPMTHVEQLHTQLNYHRVDVAVLAGNLLTPYSIGLGGTVLLCGLVLGLVVLALRLERRREGGPTAGSTALPVSPAACALIWCGILLCGYHLIYDSLLLTWPFVALVVQIAATGRRTPVGQWVALGLFAILAGNYLATATVIEGLGSRPMLSLTLASLNGAALLGLFAFYLHQVVRSSVRVYQPVPL